MPPTGGPTGMPGCCVCGAPDVACGSCTVPGGNLLLTVANWHPKFCSTLGTSCDPTRSIATLSIPILYRGGSDWSSDCFQLGFTPVGFDSYGFRMFAPHRAILQCNSGADPSIFFIIYDINYGAPAGPGLNWVADPPPGTHSCPVEGYAPAHLFTSPCTLVSVFSGSITFCRWSKVSLSCASGAFAFSGSYTCVSSAETQTVTP